MKSKFLAVFFVLGVFMGPKTEVFSGQIPSSASESEQLRDAVEREDWDSIHSLLGTNREQQLLIEAARNEDIMAMRKLMGLPTNEDFLNAATSGNISRIRQWLENDEVYDINARTPFYGHITGIYGGGLTALIHAIQRESPELVELLIAHGADVNTRDYRGTTPLIYAVGVGNLEIFNILLEANAHPDSPNYRGQTPLMGAARGGHFEIAKALIDRGADVNAVNDEGRTPFMNAARGGHLDVAVYLLTKEADADAVDKNGRTGLMLAAKAGIPTEILLALMSAGADKNAGDHDRRAEDLRSAVWNSNLAAVNALIFIGVDVNDVANGATVVMGAIRENHLGIVKALVDAKANVNAFYTYGRRYRNYTPLMFAVRLGRTDIVNFLTSVDGIDLNAENEEGDTALTLAQDFEHESVEKTLVDSGAKDCRGRDVWRFSCWSWW